MDAKNEYSLMVGEVGLCKWRGGEEENVGRILIAFNEQASGACLDQGHVSPYVIRDINPD